MEVHAFSTRSSNAGPGGSVAYLNVAAFLSLMHLPGRLMAWMAAALLGMEEHHIPILVKARLLKPLGNPPPNGVKMFWSADLLEKVSDRQWMHRAHKTVREYHRQKNARQRQRQPALPSSPLDRGAESSAAA